MLTQIINPLPPLPLTGQCLFIDNSIWMEGFGSCYRYLEYKAIRQRVLKAEKSSLNFGTAIHMALEHRYKQFQNRPVDALYYEQVGTMLTKFFEEHPSPDWRNLNWAIEVLRQYNKRYEIEGFNLLGNGKGEPLVELSFALPLCKYNLTRGEALAWQAKITDSLDKDEVGIYYTGKIDLAIHEGGQIWVMDHKTTSYLGDMFWNEMRMTGQQRGYVWAFGKLTGANVRGYKVNGIRSKEPPLYVTGQEKPKGKQYSPAKWWEETFQREQFIIDAVQLNEWEGNTIDLVEEFFFHYRRNYMPMKTKWCAFYGKCAYYQVCQMVPEDRLSILNSGDFAKHEWSPLKQVL